MSNIIHMWCKYLLSLSKNVSPIILYKTDVLVLKDISKKIKSLKGICNFILNWVSHSKNDCNNRYLKCSSSSDSPSIVAVDWKTSNISVRQLGTHQTKWEYKKMLNILYSYTSVSKYIDTIFVIDW